MNSIDTLMYNHESSKSPTYKSHYSNVIVGNNIKKIVFFFIALPSIFVLTSQPPVTKKKFGILSIFP